MMKRMIKLSALLALASIAALAADLTGTWKSEPPANGKGGPQTLTLKQDGSALTGTLGGGRGEPVEMKNGKVDGDNVSFEVTRTMQGNEMTMKYSGKVDGSTLKVSYEMRGNTRELSFTKQ